MIVLFYPKVSLFYALNLSINYTAMLKEYDINGSQPELEKDLLALFAKFCFKSEPLPIFGGKKTVSQKFSAIFNHYNEILKGGLCFHEDGKRFAVFKEGQEWLDNEIPEFAGKKLSVLIMGASLNKDLSGARYCMEILRECFRRLKEEKGFDVIAWNINRTHKKKAFERIMKLLGGKQLGDVYYV